MTTGSVIVGKADVGLIVCTPGPTIQNLMVSSPGVLLASRICCRNEPGPLSLVFVTVRPETTHTSWENSEVSLVVMLVAVELMNWPSGTLVAGWKVNDASPLA